VERPDHQHDNFYASIGQREDGSCAFFGADRLCAIQKELGPSLLTPTCSIYPRVLNVVAGKLEGSLNLSCPEAARNILLRDNATEQTGNMLSGEFRTDNTFLLGGPTVLHPQFLRTRVLMVALARDRSKPVWQRLLLVASLCKRLDEVAASNPAEAPALLDSYANALGQGPSEELERLEPDVVKRLEVAITLGDARVRDLDCRPRYRNAFWDFIEGIGAPRSEGPEGNARRLREGESYLQALLERSPFLVENYLANAMYKNLFPFGQQGSERVAARSIFDEALLLLTQFSWLMTMLAGIAGKYRSAFSYDHVIATVQPFARAVEHSPQIQDDVLEFVKGRGLDNLEGLAKLLRL